MSAPLWLALLLLARPAPPEWLDRQVKALCESGPHLHYRLAGRSPEGRPIPLAIATARPQAIEQQLRLLVVAGQHGDESSPSHAALLWLRQAAITESFERVAVLLLPLVNPDGQAVARRHNGRGHDLNRDWGARSQPETALVQRVFNRWKPHVVLDIHEFDGLVGGRRAEPDWLEMLQTGTAPELDAITSGLQRALVARQAEVGESLRPVVTTPGNSALTLCHRHFAAAHRAVALLSETGDGRPDPAARLLSLLVAELNARAAVWKPRLDRLRSLESWRAPRELVPPAAPAPPRRRSSPPVPPPPRPILLGLACYALAMVSGIKLRDDSADS